MMFLQRKRMHLLGIMICIIGVCSDSICSIKPDIKGGIGINIFNISSLIFVYLFINFNKYYSTKGLEHFITAFYDYISIKYE